MFLLFDLVNNERNPGWALGQILQLCLCPACSVFSDLCSFHSISSMFFQYILFELLLPNAEEDHRPFPLAFIRANYACVIVLTVCDQVNFMHLFLPFAYLWHLCLEVHESSLSLTVKGQLVIINCVGCSLVAFCCTKKWEYCQYCLCYCPVLWPVEIKEWMNDVTVLSFSLLYCVRCKWTLGDSG